MRIEPEAGADPHDERVRRHSAHRHARSHSAQREPNGSEGPAGGGESAQGARAQSLSRVAQVVASRMVSGSRAVAQAPVRAMVAAGSGLAAAGTSVRQSNWAELFATRPSSTAARSSVDGDSRGRGAAAAAAASRAPTDGEGEQGTIPAPLSDAVAAAPRGSPPAAPLHRKTMSLDTATAAEAGRVASAALAEHDRLLLQGGIDVATAVPPGVSPSKALMRRPSNMADVAAAQSLERGDTRVQRRGGQARASCFSACRRPLVKD